MRCTTLAIVTGASRGYGAALALALAEKWGGALEIALVARRSPELDASLLRVVRAPRPRGSPPLSARAHAIDLGDLDSLDSNLDEVFARLDPAVHERAVLINNAGSLGDLCPVGDSNDSAAARGSRLATWRHAVDLNVTSSCWLAERFVAELSRAGLVGVRREAVSVASSPPPPSLLVNVSSLAAEQPFSSWGAYCTGKAARDMLSRIVASERDAAELRVLNWAPGPMKTAMTDAILASPTVDPDILATFQSMAKGDTASFVDKKESAARCIELLQAGEFETGAHLDFFET